ncbi:MAG TPA: aminotransferase class V-fold PLP-dependent enzyme [Solirubrobacteraceae bacterium]
MIDRSLWEPEGIYLNTASYGLPPRPAWDALQRALADWHAGRTSWEAWADETDAARRLWAELVGVEPARVATGATVSGLVGLVATAVEPGARVVAPEVEFTSNLWPFMVRGCEVDLVPAGRLAEAIDARTAAVAFSAVQSATGEVADVEAIASAARHHGALTFVDATQACGWLPLDASRLDVVTCAAYKWLMSPRGTAFMSVSEQVLGRVTPAAAAWFAGEDIHGSYYGGPVRLAADARRLDTSPAWFSWVGTTPALRTILDAGVEAIHAHDRALADRFREGLGLEPTGSAIVVTDAAGAEERLQAAGVMAAMRAGRLRTSWHAHNTDDDVDRVLELMNGPVRKR